MKMQIKTLETKELWEDERRGRITGTRAGSLLSKRDKKPLKGYYELIAERVAVPASEENVMDRGLRLEGEAIDRFAKETGKKVRHTENTLCYRDDEPNIAYSPDGLIDGGVADVEVKCRNSASHIEAILTKSVPSEYEPQIIQGFVVNDDLQTRYIIFYDPRCVRDYMCIEVKREEYTEKIAIALAEQRTILAQVADIVGKFTF